MDTDTLKLSFIILHSSNSSLRSHIWSLDIFLHEPLEKMTSKFGTGLASQHMKNENEKSLEGVQSGENVSDSNGGVKNAKNTDQPSGAQNEGETQ